MSFYFSIAIVFWLFTLLNIEDSPLQPLLRACVIILFIAIAGLRFETGYDWMVYENVFVAMTKGEGITNVVSNFQMEPAFIFLCQVVSFFGGGLQSLFMVVAIFNTYAIHKYLSLTKGAFFLAVSIYFCFVYLPVQMGVIRQSIGCSFVFLSIYFLSNNKRYLSVFIISLACAFQVSLFLFLLLLLPWVSIILRRFEFTIIAASVLAIIFKLDISLMLLSFISKMGFGFVDDKIAWYMTTLQKSASLTSQLYFFFNLFFYFLFRQSEVLRSKVSVFEFNILLMLIVLQGLAWAFPLGWNRVQYVAVLVQARLLYIYIEDMYFMGKFTSIITAAIFSFLVLFWYLNNSYAMPYMPYKNYLEYSIYGDDGSGRIRAENYYVDFEQSISEKSHEK